MKQIIQNYKTGELRLVDVPKPALRKVLFLFKMKILIQNYKSGELQLGKFLDVVDIL